MTYDESTRVGMTGHQGMTTLTEQMVREEIAKEIFNYTPVSGVCSLAEGADQIFADVVLQSGGGIVAIVPCERYEETFTNADDLAEYKRLLAAAKDTVILDYDEPSESAYWAAGQRVVEEVDILLAVWDGKLAKGLGGTADVVALARERGKKVVIIWPAGSERR